jgi:hypothetical protein
MAACTPSIHTYFGGKTIWVKLAAYFHLTLRLGMSETKVPWRGQSKLMFTISILAKNNYTAFRRHVYYKNILFISNIYFKMAI